MRSNIVASYTHTDSEVRFLMRWTFATAFLSGGIVAIAIIQLMG